MVAIDTTFLCNASPSNCAGIPLAGNPTVIRYHEILFDIVMWQSNLGTQSFALDRYKRHMTPLDGSIAESFPTPWSFDYDKYFCSSKVCQAMSKEVESRGPAIVVVAIISPIISGFFVALRVYTRAFLVKVTGWEDCGYSKKNHISNDFWRVLDLSILTLVSREVTDRVTLFNMGLGFVHWL